MTPEALARYGRPVPRYTSYPTAPHFAADVDAGVYAAWLAALPAETPLSLYFHVPFCREMCWFCGCHTRAVRRYEPVADYLLALGDELALVAGILGSRRPVRHIHFGGGTPTILAGADFISLMDRIRNLFDVRPEAEIAVEVDPRTFGREVAKALATAGVTRASVGVQDFSPDVQHAINRVQSIECVAQTVGLLRGSDIAAINFDLMYGLPFQTPQRVAASARLAADMAPDRLALFGYAHVPWMKRHQRLIDESWLPDGLERRRQYEVASARLVDCGYAQIGLDHFARPGDPLAAAARAGTLHRNFQGYTTDAAGALVGFGASAIGALPQGYVQNAVPLRQYRDAVAHGRLATVRGKALDDDDRLRREVIERLMCDLEVDLDAVCTAHGRQAAVAFAAELASLAPFVADGIVVRRGRRVAVTEPGRPYLRSVSAVFDSYLDSGRGRHSQAV